MYNNRKIWSVSYPMLLSLLAQNIINLTDTAFLGHYSEIALGASAIGGLFYICAFTIAFGFSTGSQIVISRRNGEEKYEDIGPVVHQGVGFLLLIATVLFTLSQLYADDLLRFMLSSEAVYNDAVEFIDWRVFGFFFSAINIMFRAFYIGITRTKVLIINALVMAVVNILLDYALIFGHFGMQEMGIKGAAIASVISEATSVIFFFVYTYIKIDAVKYGLNRFRAFSYKLLLRVLNISSFTMVQYLLSMLTWTVFFVAVERLGETELAISNIIRSIYMILLIPMHSLGLTCNSLVSNTIGAGKTEEVLPLVKRISIISLVIMVCIVTVVSLFPSYILSLYTANTVMIEQSVASVWSICIAVLIASFGSMYFYAISGTGNTMVAFVIELITVILYSAYIFIVCLWLRASIEICFAIEILYYLMMFILSYIYLKRGKWQGKTI